MTMFEYVSVLSATIKMYEQGCITNVDPLCTMEDTVNKQILEKKSHMLIERKIGYVKHITEL